MTKLFVNGCSFTAGNGEVHTADGSLAPPLDYVWANQIPEVESVTNLAISGGSNDRILRTTMEYFNSLVSCTGYVAVIQWTSPLRFERYIPSCKAFAGFCNTSSTTLKQATNNDTRFSFNMDNAKHLEQLDNNGMYDRLTDAASQLLLYGKSVNDCQINFYKKVILMQQYLDSKNIPYMFTSMSFYNHLNPTQPYMSVDQMENTPTQYEIHLKNNVDTTKWTDRPLTSYQAGNFISAQDKHPDENGHKLIGNEIYKELQLRNFV
jgi:hypothetical protein